MQSVWICFYFIIFLFVHFICVLSVSGKMLRRTVMVFPQNVLKHESIQSHFCHSSEISTWFSYIGLQRELEDSVFSTLCFLTSSFCTQFPTVSPWQTEAKDNQALEKNKA